MKCTPIRRKQTPGIGSPQLARVVKISALLSVTGCLLAATGLPAEDCWRESVDASWEFEDFNFATWGDTDQSRAVLVDMFARRSLDLVLIPSADSGTLVPQPQSSVKRASDLFAESTAFGDDGEPIQELTYSIKRSNGGFIGLNLNANTGIPSAVQWYDSGLSKLERTELMNRIGMAGELIEDNRVMAMRGWQPVADQFFAVGALGIAGRLDHFWEGFYVTQLQTPGNDNATPMARMVSDLHGQRHYAFPSHEFIAVDGDVVFFLEMSTELSLRYYDTRSGVLGRLEGFPGSDKRIPYPLLDRIDMMYKSVEAMEIPVGLYSSGGYLYAVVRSPKGNGVTSWTVVKLRPDFNLGTVENLGAVRLPTQEAARHLYMLPGESTWLMLELGSMPPRIMKHRLLAAVTIPRNWISEPQASPLVTKTRSRTPVGCLSPP